MKTKTLFFAPLFILLSSPSFAAQHTAEQKAALNTAIQNEINCGKQHVEEVDDGMSDASTVALALAGRCGNEYNASTEAVIAANLDNEAQARMFREARATKDKKVEEFLGAVMVYRKSLKKAAASN